MTDKAFAKINLTLDIVGKRSDGYHLLETVMREISLCDEITVEKADEIEIICREPGVPKDEKNTCYKAAELFFGATKIRGGARIEIKKRIPSQAGLGGGSSDAAAVLKLLNIIYGAGLSIKRLEEIAAKVGADVAFFIKGGAAVCKGAGEQTESLPNLPERYVLIVKPEFGVSTPEAYKKFDEKGLGSKHGTPKFLSALERGENPYLCLSSDLEDSAEDQRIEKIKGEIAAFGAEAVQMSGSGSAVFGLFEDKKAAESAEAALKGRYPFVCLCKSI